MISARDLASATLWLAAALLVLAGPALLGGGTVGPDAELDRDLLHGALPTAATSLSDKTPTLVDYPRDLMVARHARTGWLPKWNPYSAFGAPLWAEQGGPFFPLRAVFYAWPTPVTYDLFLCLRLLAAGLGGYVLARGRGLRHGPALGAGALYELSGPMVESYAFASASALCPLLPWLLAGGGAVARWRDGRAAALTALAVGAALSGGHPALALVVCAGYAAAALAHAAAEWRRPRAAASILGWSTAAAVLGLCVAAPTILPQLELAGQASSYKLTPRGDSAWTIALGQSRGAALPAVVAPHVLSLLRTTAVLTHSLAPTVGVVGLVLALAGIMQRGLDRPLIAVLALGLCVALVPPGTGWLFAPRATRLILPLYAWALVVLPLTQAAGTALQTAAGRRGRRAIALALVLTLAAIPVLLVSWNVLWLPLALVPKLAFGTVDGALRLLLPCAAVVATVLALARAAAGVSARRAIPVALAVLAVAELWWLWAPFLQQPASRTLVGAPPPAVAFLRQALAAGDARFIGLSGDRRRAYSGLPAVAVAESPGRWLSPMLFELPAANGASALPIARTVAYMRAIGAGSTTSSFNRSAPAVPRCSTWRRRASSSSRAPTTPRRCLRPIRACRSSTATAPSRSTRTTPRCRGSGSSIACCRCRIGARRCRRLRSGLGGCGARRRAPDRRGDRIRRACRGRRAAAGRRWRSALRGIGAHRRRIHPDHLWIEARLAGPALVVVAERTTRAGARSSMGSRRRSSRSTGSSAASRSAPARTPSRCAMRRHRSATGSRWPSPRRWP